MRRSCFSIYDSTILLNYCLDQRNWPYKHHVFNPYKTVDKLKKREPILTETSKLGYLFVPELHFIPMQLTVNVDLTLKQVNGPRSILKQSTS